MEKFATAMVGETRFTGNTAEKLVFTDTGNLEKKTRMGKLCAGEAVDA